MLVPPLVGIAIAAYNAEAFPAPGIDSVLAQTDPSWQLVVVGDGSTNSTYSIAREYAARETGIATTIYVANSSS